MLTALLLAQQGVRTRIIDMKSRTATHSYACALHPASLRILERAGIVEDVLELGRSVGTVGVYEGATRHVQAQLSDLPGRYPFAAVLAQFLLEELLEEKLRTAGVPVEWHRRLREISRGANGVDATVEKLHPSGLGHILPELETTGPEPEVVRADFAIGADGHASRLRQQLGISLVRAGDPMLFGVYEFETVEPLDHEMKLVLNGPDFDVLWPLADNKCRWSFQLAPRENPAGFPPGGQARQILVQPPGEWDGFQHLRRLLAERAPWFRPEIKDILWITHVQFERQLVVRYGEGRCWLAGDAAHQASPGGMHSMNRGLLEAADLADNIKSILHGDSDLDMLQDFDRVHRAEWKRLLGLKEPDATPDGLSPWARQHLPTLIGNLPASGEDLQHLLEQL
jgi:NADPH-dependent dioxygenase